MGTGTEVAIQSAGITLVKDDRAGVAQAIVLVRAAMRNIRQNLVFAFAYNAIGIPTAPGAPYPAFGLIFSQIFGIVRSACLNYAARVRELPREPTSGSRMNGRLASFTMSFFDALLASGVERAYAIELWSALASALTYLTPGETTAFAFTVISHEDRQDGIS